MVSPPWLDRGLFPFTSRFLTVPHGRMHYVDEGQGQAVVFVHGVPAWSFTFRHLVRELAATHRCVAMDHLGFGLSDKPALVHNVPQTLAKNVERLIESLELGDVTLVVHDWGGPMGLAYALEHPQNVRRLVLLNTWLWGASVDVRTAIISRLLASPFYWLLEDRLNFTARMFIPNVMAKRSRLTREIHRHYVEPLRGAQDRRIQWQLVRSILHASDWLEALWAKREALRDISTLVAWGVRDRAFSLQDLARWQRALPHARVHRLLDAGHFPHEEAPAEVHQVLKSFLE